MSKAYCVEVGKYQHDYCRVCYEYFPTSELVRALKPVGHEAGQNALLHSRYNSSFWTVDTAVDKGRISMGAHVLDWEARLNQDDTWTERGGSQTWSGSGTLRSVTAVDVSDFSNIYFGVDMGKYQYLSGLLPLSIVLGFTDSTGSTKYPIRTWSVLGDRRCWFSIPIADHPDDPVLSYFYVDVTTAAEPSYTNAGYWWADQMHLADVSAAKALDISAIPPTFGTSDTWTKGHRYGVIIQCSVCARDKYIKPSETYSGPYRFPEWEEIKDGGGDL